MLKQLIGFIIFIMASLFLLMIGSDIINIWNQGMQYVLDNSDTLLELLIYLAFDIFGFGISFILMKGK